MGIADFITLANGLLGVAALMFIILAVEDLQNPFFDQGIKTNYVWGAMTCIMLSVIGDEDEDEDKDENDEMKMMKMMKMEMMKMEMMKMEMMKMKMMKIGRASCRERV